MSDLLARTMTSAARSLVADGHGAVANVEAHQPTREMHVEVSPEVFLRAFAEGETIPEPWGACDETNTCGVNRV